MDFMHFLWMNGARTFPPLPLGTEKQCRSRFRGESPFIEFVVPGYALSFEEDEREVLGP